MARLLSARGRRCAVAEGTERVGLFEGARRVGPSAPLRARDAALLDGGVAVLDQAGSGLSLVEL